MKKLFSLLLCTVLIISALSATAAAKDSQPDNTPLEILSAQPGQIITYGHYEQDNNLSNGKEPIEWLVLAREGDMALVISRYSLESRPYNDEREEVTWETCTLRTWLNSTFLITAFAASERKAIPAVTVVADNNPEDGTNGGKNTRDKIFLLSASEFDTCFPTEAARAKSSNLWSGYGWDSGYGFGWYLRTPGVRSESTMVAYTYWEGDNGGAEITSCRAGYDYLGTEVDSCYVGDGSGEYEFYAGVRPAMWISLNPKAYAATDSAGVQDGIFIDGGVAFLTTDGTVRILQDDRFSMESNYFHFPLSECEDWTDITQLRVCNYAIAGLRTDGTVVASGKDEYVQAVSKWNHITELYSLSYDYAIIAGLRSDGRILVAGDYLGVDWEHEAEKSPFVKEIESWKNVKKLNIGSCFGTAYAAALHKDGTVSYYNPHNLEWSGSTDDVIDLACTYGGAIALREDGTCVVTSPEYREITDTWTDLKQVGCGIGMAIGLRDDGTIVTTWVSPEDDAEKTIHEELSALRDVDRIECDPVHNFQIYRKDGTVEFFSYYGEQYGNDEIRSCTDIEKMIISTSYDPLVIVGIKTDGSLISNMGKIQLNEQNA